MGDKLRVRGQDRGAQRGADQKKTKRQRHGYSALPHLNRGTSLIVMTLKQGKWASAPFNQAHSYAVHLDDAVCQPDAIRALPEDDNAAADYAGVSPFSIRR